MNDELAALGVRANAELLFLRARELRYLLLPEALAGMSLAFAFVSVCSVWQVIR